MNKSEGHIVFMFDEEFFIRAGALIRAPTTNVIMPDGYRCGRWECSKVRAFQKLKMMMDFAIYSGAVGVEINGEIYRLGGIEDAKALIARLAPESKCALVDRANNKGVGSISKDGHITIGESLNA